MPMLDTKSTGKAQPWKKTWPPKSAVQAGETHGFKKGETLQLEGSAGAHPDVIEKQNEQ